MPDQDVAASSSPPFAMFTVSQRGTDQVVSVTFRSGCTSEPDSASPSAECFVYPDRAPILALDQGTIHAQISPGSPEHVAEEDLRLARDLAHASLRYFETLRYWY